MQNIIILVPVIIVIAIGFIECGIRNPFKKWSKHRRFKKTGRDVDIIISRERSRNYK